MSTYNLLPEPDALRNHLRKSLNELDNRVAISQHVAYPDLETRLQLITANLDGDDWEVVLKPNWNFSIEDSRDFPNGSGRGVIGGHIKVENGEFQTYSLNLSIMSDIPEPHRFGDSYENPPTFCCAEHNPGKLGMVERIHFDVDIPGLGDESKPVSHIQNGGKITDENIIHENFHYCHNGVDKPRIPYPPMDIVLLLDIVLRQYGNLKGLVDSEWESMVQQSEEVLWGNFYEKLASRYLGDSGLTGTVHGMMENSD